MLLFDFDDGQSVYDGLLGRPAMILLLLLLLHEETDEVFEGHAVASSTLTSGVEHELHWASSSLLLLLLLATSSCSL